MPTSLTVPLAPPARSGGGDLDFEVGVGGAEGVLDGGGVRGPGEEEAQVAVAFGEGADLATTGDRELQGGDAGDGPGVVLAVDGDQAAGPRDGEHHHAGGDGLPAGVEGQAEGV